MPRASSSQFEGTVPLGYFFSSRRLLGNVATRVFDYAGEAKFLVAWLGFTLGLTEGFLVFGVFMVKPARCAGSTPR